jgi:hypothetical protein
MFTRSVVVDTELSQGHVPSRENVSVQSQLRLWLVGFAGLLSLCLTLLVLGIMSVARIGTIPQFLDLPDSYLPGNLQPKEVSCYTYISEPFPHCSIQLLDYKVYFTFDAQTRTIMNTVISAHPYTIGQLILYWGTPTGINWNEYTIYIYWGTRSAMLSARSLRPDSRVRFILYDLEQPEASPWQGFRRRKD